MAKAAVGHKCVQATAAMRDGCAARVPGAMQRFFSAASLNRDRTERRNALRPRIRSLLRLVGRGLLAFRHELLALLAMDALGVGVLRALQRGGGARRLGL